MALLVLIEPLGDIAVVEGISVVGAVQDVLLAPAIHHLACQRQHLHAWHNCESMNRVCKLGPV